MKIKTNDNVKILSGKDRGKSGKVVQVFPAEKKIVVEGVNIMKKHLRSRKKGEKGQMIELAGPLTASKAAVICPKCSKAMRVAYKIDPSGAKKRICRDCHEIIE